jgi:hypothetical protein
MGATAQPPPFVVSETATRSSSVVTRWTHVAARVCRRAPLGVVSAIILICIAVIAVTANDLAPFDPLKTNFSQTRKAPSLLHL